MTQSEPGRLDPLRRPLGPKSIDEVDEEAEQWIIDDLDPLHHEEHAIR